MAGVRGISSTRQVLSMRNSLNNALCGFILARNGGKCSGVMELPSQNDFVLVPCSLFEDSSFQIFFYLNRIHKTQYESQRVSKNLE